MQYKNVASGSDTAVTDGTVANGRTGWTNNARTGNVTHGKCKGVKYIIKVL